MDEVGPSNQEEFKGYSGLDTEQESALRWRPRQLVFRPYSSINGADRKLRVVVRKPKVLNKMGNDMLNSVSLYITRAREESRIWGMCLSLTRVLGAVFTMQLVARLTKDIIETYQICNPKFKYSEELNPKWFLTSPSVGVLNDGHDNVNSDLILTVNFVLINLETRRRYIVKNVLGHGTFGQVAKCWVPETSSFVAVKIIKNQPAYYQQALVEVSVLTTLKKKYDPEDEHHIVRIYDYFVYQHHLCICFELLDTNLYELIKINHFRGLSLSIIQLFSKQILRGLTLLKDAGIIHCDLKPENILLCTSVKPAEIKIIDFGSACMEDWTVYSYIQSRYYRSPEVLLGYQHPFDMNFSSLNLDHLIRYTTAIDMWSFGCIVAELFLGLPLFPGASEFDLLRRMVEILGGQPPDYVLKEAKNTSKFFKCVGRIHSIGNSEVCGRSAYQVLTEEEYEARELKKPLIGKEYFNHKNLEAIVTCYPYRKNLPKEDIIKESQIRLALIDFLRGLVEFDPAKRWSPFQASKHPFVTGEPFTRPYRPPPETPHLVDHHPGGGHWFAAGLSPNASKRNRVTFHNSPQFPMVPYGHANCYSSMGSLSSYNDNVGSEAAMGSGASMLGGSPKARWRIMQYSHGNGVGMSPSAKNFALLHLGTSPSQFTPPSSYGQGSVGSPGHYGPTSPARNRQVTDGNISNQAERNSQVVDGLPSCIQSNSSSANWKQQQGGIGMATSYSIVQNIPKSIELGSSLQLQYITGATQDKSEASMPLPEDGSDESHVSAEFDRGMQIGSADSSVRIGRFNHASSTASSNLSTQRILDFYFVCAVLIQLMLRTLDILVLCPQILTSCCTTQNSQSLSRQQNVQRFNHGRSAGVRDREWNQ
ncbi:serine/threonine-protein kinase ppk15-like [Gossypium australe]|uniref:Serine/threonine-protein kinase ppk15-like n=1 Tax=Gossypium australe TaxID=47621 RepID=A0A5B6VH45_9ROSI|nr:serine/threonine-protein kinase ppk15-like [Gossypium australe]